MEIYHRLETPKLWAVIKEQTVSDDAVLIDGDLVDPDSVQIIIEDSVGKVVQVLANMSTDDKGKYYYDGYTLPVNAKLGVWNWEVRAAQGTKIGTGRSSFIVKEQVV